MRHSPETMLPPPQPDTLASKVRPWRPLGRQTNTLSLTVEEYDLLYYGDFFTDGFLGEAAVINSEGNRYLVAFNSRVGMMQAILLLDSVGHQEGE